jgi:L-aspartate oxidase
MPSYHEKAELAPRDVVARAIVSEMTKNGADSVFLDISHLAASRITSRFPQIYRHCLDHGVDITKELVPVSPAAHYMMGGVRTNTWGETSMPGLYACGECACTGVHGANRLASNSLLETVVFAKRIVERIVAGAERATPSSGGALAPRDAPDSEHGLPGPPDLIRMLGASNDPPPPANDQPTRAGLQALMWDRVGIVRDGAGLAAAADQIRGWRQELPAAHDRPSHELATMLLVGQMMAEAALAREESRGAHYRTDFPEPRDEWRRHIVFRQGA